METGLHYNRFRYYDPDAGRFISHDPINLNGGNNHYQYAFNPIDSIDYFGWMAHSYLNVDPTKVIRQVTIQMQGSRGLDFAKANECAGIESSSGNFSQKAHKDRKNQIDDDSLVWHHAGYNAANNTVIMQLIKVKDHKTTHKRAVQDFKDKHGVGYDNQKSIKKAKELNSCPELDCQVNK